MVIWLKYKCFILIIRKENLNHSDLNPVQYENVNNLVPSYINMSTLIAGFKKELK